MRTAGMCLQLIVCVLLVLSVTEGGDPPGHLQPLGSHIAPQKVEVLSDFPHPADFYENYIQYGKPVLFKSVLEKNNFKPFREWNDKYLREHFGRYIVQVEEGKKEDRTKDVDQVTFGEFLDTYTKDDVYLVQDLTPKMMNDVSLPYSIRCGGPQKLLTKMIMWFSSGGTKSVLHMDEFENINCLLDGTKDLVLFDKIYGQDIETDGFVWDGSYSSVDVDSVDMYQFPLLKDMPWYKTYMEKGDCLYIPSRWYHQVNSHGSRNLAINAWFYHPHWFNVSDCSQDETWKTPHPISKFGFAVMGEGLRYLILEPLEMEESLSLDEFLERWEIISIDTKESSKLFHHIDVSKDELLTWDELYSFGVEEVYKKFPKAFGNDFREQYREKKSMMEMMAAGDQEEVPDVQRDEL